MPRHHDTRQTLYDAPVRVWDETPAEAREREAQFETHCRANDRADELREIDARKRMAAELAEDNKHRDTRTASFLPGQAGHAAKTAASRTGTNGKAECLGQKPVRASHHHGERSRTMSKLHLDPRKFGDPLYLDEMLERRNELSPPNKELLFKRIRNALSDYADLLEAADEGRAA